MLFILFICYSFFIHYDAVDDGDNVDVLEVDYCFDFGEEVVLEAVVPVVVGNSGIASAWLVIGDKIDDDNYDVLGIVLLFNERISPFSFFIIYIIIINKNKYI